MTEKVLNDKAVLPSNEVLKPILGESFAGYILLNEKLAGEGIVPEWNYYRDGNSWLCKMLFKKKNLGWIHIYAGYFMVTFYFTEKHLEQIAELDISEGIKKEFFQAKSIGKLIPMSFTSGKKSLPEDIMKVVLFKKNLK